MKDKNSGTVVRPPRDIRVADVTRSYMSMPNDKRPKTECALKPNILYFF